MFRSTVIANFDVLLYENLLFFLLASSHNTSWPLHNIIIVHTWCFWVDNWNYWASVWCWTLRLLHCLDSFLANMNFICPFLALSNPQMSFIDFFIDIWSQSFSNYYSIALTHNHIINWKFSPAAPELMNICIKLSRWQIS